MKKLVMFEAIATLVGTIIGAGIFAIPYVVAKAGFVTGLIDIIVLGFAMMLIALYIGEISLRTRGFHQLTGYIGKYLGRFGKGVMMFAMVFGIYGALVAYMLGEGEALTAVTGFGNPLFWSMMFFAGVSMLVYFGLKVIERFELMIVPVVIAIVVLIAIFGFKHVNVENLTGFDITRIFLPYGVVLFAFSGGAAVCEMREELVKNERLMKKSIIIGMMIPMIVYILFALVTVGITGKATTDVATIGLGIALGEKMLLLGNLFAVFAMTTCFLALGMALKDMWHFDFKLGKTASWFLTCIVPFMLFFVLRKFVGFGTVIGVTGAIGSGIGGVMIVLAAWRARKYGERKPEYVVTGNNILGYLLIAMFLFGIVYEVLRFAGIIKF